MRWRAAVIGCGAQQRHGDEGFAIGHAHGASYRALPGVDLVAACDVDADNLRRFQERFAVPRGYLDYRELLAQEKPDVVSVCVPVGWHREMVVACAEAGVRAVLCEKPLALSLEDVDAMVAACRRAGTTLALNTQRRFGARWRAARELVARGAIGEPLRFEGTCPGWDLLEWGTHWVDMARFFAGEAPAEWVFAQVDAATPRHRYGHRVENDALVAVGYAGGFRALLFMGEHAPPAPANRLLGTEGVLEVDGAHGTRYVGADTAGWQPVEVGADPRDPIQLSIEALLEAAEARREPPHGATCARAVMEVVLAAYESAAQGRVVALPLAARDFPLERLVARYAR